MKRWFLVLLALFVGLAMPAFGLEGGEESPITYTVGEDGATLNVVLKANATTGYMWTCGGASADTLAETSNEYVVGSEDDIAGAGGHAHFSFEAAPGFSGSVMLTFSYEREWEENPVTVYEMDIAVAENGALSVEDVRRTVPQWEIGDMIACPECGNAEAVIAEVISGGDEETGVVYFLTIECPECGTVEDMGV